MEASTHHGIAFHWHSECHTISHAARVACNTLALAITYHIQQCLLGLNVVLDCHVHKLVLLLWRGKRKGRVSTQRVHQSAYSHDCGTHDFTCTKITIHDNMAIITSLLCATLTSVWTMPERWALTSWMVFWTSISLSQPVRRGRKESCSRSVSYTNSDLQNHLLTVQNVWVGWLVNVMHKPRAIRATSLSNPTQGSFEIP